MSIFKNRQGTVLQGNVRNSASRGKAVAMSSVRKPVHRFYNTMVADAVEQGRIFLAAEGIYSTTDTNDILYGECLARVGDENGTLLNTGNLIAYLDTFKLTPSLDRHVLSLVLDRLEREPSLCLGCNISAANLADRTAWRDLFDLVAARPHLANRLVLEVIETVALQAVSLAAIMFEEARSLGCRIAVDDFGVGFSSPGLIQKIKFDIIKIDKFFVHTVKPSATGGDSFAHMVGFASSYAPHVVVEGVETETYLERACAAGATHVQGHYFPQLFSTVPPPVPRQEPNQAISDIRG